MTKLDLMRVVKRGTPRQVLFRFLARAVASAGQAALLVLLARLFGPEDFGAYAMVWSGTYFIGAILGFGASTRILRISAEEYKDEVNGGLFIARLVGAMATLAFGLGLSNFVQAGVYGILAVIWAVGDQIVDFSIARQSGYGKHAAASMLVIAQRAIPLLSVATLVFVEVNQYFWMVVPSSIFVALLILKLSISLRRAWPRLSVMRDSKGYWSASLVSNLNQLEPLALRLVSSEAVVGAYSIAGRLGGPLTIFVSAMQSIFVPMLAASLKTPKFSRVYRVVYMSSVAYAVLLILLSPFIVEFVLNLLGEDYLDSRPILFSVVIAAGLASISQAYQSKFLAEGRPGLSSLVVAMGTVTGIIILMAVASTIGPGFLWIPPIAAQILILSGMILMGRHFGRAS